MTREEFLALANAQYEKLAELQSKPTFFEYEEGFVKIWTDGAGRHQVMQASLDKSVTSEKKLLSNPIRENRANKDASVQEQMQWFFYKRVSSKVDGLSRSK